MLRRLTTTMQPMVLEWREVGCAYNTGQGLRVVLQVRCRRRSAGRHR
jgi:hypothetical protein